VNANGSIHHGGFLDPQSNVGRVNYFIQLQTSSSDHRRTTPHVVRLIRAAWNAEPSQAALRCDDTVRPPAVAQLLDTSLAVETPLVQVCLSHAPDVSVSVRSSRS
jgi:hypothetical protein